LRVIVEGLLQRVAQLGLGRQLGNPAFDLVALTTVDDFKMVNGQIVLRFGHGFACRLSLFAKVSIHHGGTENTEEFLCFKPALKSL
jgi:hypothetical protein